MLILNLTLKRCINMNDCDSHCDLKRVLHLLKFKSAEYEYKYKSRLEW
jgi:hypothetical protein